MLKFWSLIYRLTGWYSPWARIAEYEAFRKWIETLGFPDDVGIFIGSWQAEHKFYRKWRI